MKAGQIFQMMRGTYNNVKNSETSALVFMMWENHITGSVLKFDQSSLKLSKFAKEIYESS